jgi:site-specific recombinase XerC
MHRRGDPRPPTSIVHVRKPGVPPQPEHPGRLRRRGAWLFRLARRQGIGALGAIRTHHVSTYIESRTRSYRAPTVKQHLAALRMLFDWLIVGQVVEPARPSSTTAATIR